MRDPPFATYGADGPPTLNMLVPLATRGNCARHPIPAMRITFPSTAGIADLPIADSAAAHQEEGYARSECEGGGLVWVSTSVSTVHDRQAVFRA